MSQLDSQMADFLDAELVQADQGAVSVAANVDPAVEGSHQTTECAPDYLSRLKDDIVRTMANTLKLPLDKVDDEENIAVYGVDSIRVTEIIQSLAAMLQTQMMPMIFFEAKNIKNLAAIIGERFQAKVVSYYQKTQEASGLAHRKATNGNAYVENSSIDEKIMRWIQKSRSSGRLAIAQQTTEGRSDALEAYASAEFEPIAIIGMDGIFPESPDLTSYWRNLYEGKDCINEVPRDRWDWKRLYGDPTKGPFTRVKWGGFLGEIDKFDAFFFGISPREAEFMDPQHRLFLECSWRMMETAGYCASALSNRAVGIFLGVNLQDYWSLVRTRGHIDPRQLTGLGHMFCPNRLSFLLNATGPSEIIDTACSSSLVAVNRAAAAIHCGDCEMAIVGGSNLMITPEMHLIYTRMGMICEDGRCKTFSKDANGYARAEGVGAVLLKSLAHAERDEDRILGVLRGSFENHGGTATSLTAPNPAAQARAIIGAHRRAGIDPRAVGYVECHGTGTALGDPIEINGLKMAFAERYRDHKLPSPRTPYCGLGSVKSNIGHAETSAGIAGVIKVLLAMQYGYLPASLHCKEINPLIEINDSPFFVLQKGKPWGRMVIDGKEHPRIAGVSSFGAGGANAHVILEEYIRQQHVETESPVVIGDSDPFVIVLSAKDDERLRAWARQLLTFLRHTSECEPQPRLEDIAYTLQVARDAMEYRATFLVKDFEDLRDMLEAFVTGEGEVAGCLHGHIKRTKQNLNLLQQDADPSGTAEKWIALRQMDKLAELWVKGLSVDWQQLYRSSRPRRIPLPTYPFARNRYWIPENAASPTLFDCASGINLPRFLHPLVQENTSNFGNQEFTTRFSGEEFFLNDHRVWNDKILPGVAYLEMARAAVVLAGKEDTLAIRNVVWPRPLKVEGEVQVTIRLSAERDAVKYEIRTSETLHSQGKVLIGPTTGSSATRINVGAIRQRCESEIDAAELYAGLAQFGLNYGETFQGIDRLWLNGKEALARIQLPERAKESLEHFKLHPSVMDAALQTVAGLTLRGRDSRMLYVPFSVDSVEFNGPTPEQGYAYACLSAGMKKSADTISCDVQIIRDNGEVCLSMKEFSARAVESHHPERTMTLATTQWRGKDLEAPSDSPRPRVLVMLAGLDAGLEGQLHESFPRAVERLPAYKASGIARYAVDIFGRVFDRVQSMIHAKDEERRRILVIVPYEVPEYVYAPIVGLFKSARLEYSRVEGKLISIATMQSLTVIEAIRREACSAYDGEQIRYGSSGQRESRMIEEVSERVESVNSWIRPHGVYWITGGAGGLGQIFARHLTQTPDVRVVLSGRSELNAEKETVLAQAGPRITYLPTDVSRLDSVQETIRTIGRVHGRLDGIIHAAGIIRDNFIANKTRAEIETVFAPKAAGLLNIDETTQGLGLDFLVLFSSVAGLTGNAGQADYAGANAFMDAFAAYRADLVKQGKRRGKTVSINWPLWRDGGMKVDPATERLMADSMGLVPLVSAQGLKAFEKALNSTHPQYAVMPGNIEMIRRKVLNPVLISHSAAHLPAPAQLADKLSEKVEKRLLRIVGRILKISERDIPLDEELNAFGFDSVTLTELVNLLNQEFEIELTPTIFFEYPRLIPFRDYLVENHGEAFVRKFETEKVADPFFLILPDATPERCKVETSSNPGPCPKIPADKAESVFPPNTDGIAIIGMSGRFPKAKNLEELWQRLREGNDCITEVPAERWVWREIYGDPIKEHNRTNVKWGGFIDDVDKFDPLFFGISPEEAGRMDPNQRLLMEYAWMAIEDAGYSAKALWGSNTGIFVATADSGYARMVAEANLPLEAYSSTGSVPSVGPNRISYFLNLHGPSEPVETACSSSLVAIHRGVEAIRNGTCDQAIVGGVNTILTPDGHIMFSRAGMLCEDGRCKSFSRQANGYVRAEGVGILFIKRLGRAIRDRDHIYGIILGSWVNHGGRANSLTAPNVTAQADLLQQAYRRAGIDPRTVTYIETHGSGTALGDPVEIDALKKAFRGLSVESDLGRHRNCCGLGTIKSNIGHAELAAGIAGVLKVLLAMKHQQLPPSLHCEELNPYIQLEDSPFYIVRQRVDWARIRDASGAILPRRAGISSFGYGGAYAHVVIEEYITNERERRTDARPAPAIVPLSAKSQDPLKAVAKNLLLYLQDSTPDFQDLAYTMQVGREHMSDRIAFAVKDISELQDKLGQFLAGATGENVFQGRVRKRQEGAISEISSALKEMLSNGPKQEHLAKICEIWVQGEEVDWDLFWECHQPRRLSLPTYPFARERYWIPDSIEKTARTLGPAGMNDLPASGEPGIGMFLLTPLWEPFPVHLQPISQSALSTIVIAGDTVERLSRVQQYFPHAQCFNCSWDETEEALSREWEALGPVDHIVWLSPATASKTVIAEDLLRDQEHGLLFLFRTIKALLRIGYGSKTLEWTVITFQTQAVHQGDGIEPAHSGLHGLVGSMAKEYPQWKLRLVDLPLGQPLPADQILSLSPDSDGNAYAYRNAQWHRQRLVPLRRASLPSAATSAYRQNGVYVVIGGAGGIGELWTEWMIREHRAQVIWLGRRRIDSAIRTKIDRVSRAEIAPLYLSADAASLEDLERAYREIKQKFSRIHGVVHSAIDLQDRSLANMEESHFRRAFSTKAEISLRLAQVFREEPLDFLLFFSSVMSFTKLAGQSNYAAGCVFQDAFARRLAQEWHSSVKVMNWGYWGNVGTVASPEYRERMARQGIGSIEFPEAAEALHALLTGPMGQLALVNTTKLQALREMETDEVVEVCSLTAPSVIDSLRLETRLSEMAEAAVAI